MQLPTYTPEDLKKITTNLVKGINERRKLAGLPPLSTGIGFQGGLNEAARPEGVIPAGVLYGDEDERVSALRRRRRRKRSGTMLTGGKGVLGDAPVEKKTLLGS